MSCTIKVKQSSVTEQLRAEVGTNEVLFQSYFSEVMVNEDFTPKFNEWCETNLGKTFDINDDSSKEEAVNAIKRYYNQNRPDINYSSLIQNDSTTVGHFGYSSVAVREFSKRIAANCMLSAYSQLLHDKNVKIEDAIKAKGFTKKKEYFAAAVTGMIGAHLRNRLISNYGMSMQAAHSLVCTYNFSEIEKLITERSSIQDKNLLALYKEIRANREQFFTEVFRDSRLGDLRIDKDENFGETDLNNSANENDDNDGTNPDGEENNKPTDDDKDTTIMVLDNKLGTYTTFMTHVGMGIRSYLNSLKKLNSSDTTDFDLNNELGIPDTMNADECCSILYSYGDFTNVSQMIASIREIANNVPGFAGLHQMANYLEENQDFAFEVYRTFGKIVISKMETVMDGNTGKTRISNRSADKLTYLRFEFLNSVKATSIIIEDLNSKALYNELKDKINAFKTFSESSNERLKAKSETKKREIIAELANQLRRYYPTIDDISIANYVENSNDKNPVNNFNTLATILKETIDASYKTQQNYNSRMGELAEINRFNDKLRADKEQGQRLNEQPKSSEEIWATPYIDSSTQSAAFELANELVKFTMVKTELNSRNVHGNQSSDVINNSMITNVINTLKSETALENFGKYKSQSRQYDFSNIMVEHKDANGNIINYGLFTQDPDTKEFTPTSYAQRLIKARLFSGATDIITSGNVLYSEMSKGDYVATSFVNFFNVEEANEKTSDGTSISFANYFMRIPSDAPKNFIMMAPKYSVGETAYGKNNGLFRIENEVEANKKIYQKINALATLGQEYEKLPQIAVKRSLNQLISNVTSKNIGNIYLADLKAVYEDKPKIGDTITVTFDYEYNNEIHTQYVLEGTLAKDNGRNILQTPKFKGFVGDTKSSDVMRSLEKHFEKELIKSGDIKRSINTEHPIYQQFRQAIVQELNDAATALDRFFSNRDGLIEIVSDENDPRYGQPVFKEGWSNDEHSLRKLFAVYHHKGTSFVVGEDENGKDIVVKQKGIIQDVYEEVLDENGEPKKTSSGSIIYRKKNVPKQLTGSVFTSDRFKITHTNTDGSVSTRNYGQEIIDEAVDFLYGAANGKYIHTTRTAKGVNVVLTSEQEAKVQEKLSEFINDYIADTENRMSDYSEFIPENLMTSNNIAEFALNHHLMYINFNDFFEGDTKFYKDTQTFLKRAKEAQGSGVPYGIVDYNMDLSAPRDIVASRLNSKTFTRTKEDGTKENVEIKQYNKFRGVTIKNTIRTSAEVAAKGVNGATEDGAVTKNLIKALIQTGMKKADAEVKARNMMKGYHGTTVNDAQSYITFEEWVRRVAARGQLEKYMPLIENILDETKPLDAKTIAEFVQVQKNFYYDQHYNAELGVIAPRQIKNAEFVLVPRLIKGTQLEQVYNMMQQNGIDQLNTEETSKAGKANVLTIWDNDGNITQKNIDDFNANAAQATELYNYNYLYTQQETPQHLDAENKAGIQIMKKILDNIDDNSPLAETKKKFFRLYSENIKDSFSELMEEFNLETDENGNLKLDDKGNIKGLDYNVFFDRLQDEVARLGLDSNMLDYVTLSDAPTSDIATNSLLDKPNTKMPTYMSNVSTKLESIAQSLFNSRITRQKLPGFHAAQITNVGWRAMNETVERRTYSKELKYHPDGKPYVEIMLPKSAFNLKYEKPDGTRKTDEELLKEIQDAKIDEVIGYRIPTEGKQSICIMKVVGFTDDALGSTIVVPDDWVSQTGSDFDIDSVYGINFTTFLDKKGTVHKVDYKEEADKFDWFRYINRNLQKKLNSRVKSQVEEASKQASQMLNDAFRALQDEEGEAYHALPDNIRQIIKRVHENFANDANKSKKDNYVAKLNAVKTAIDSEIANGVHSEELTKQLEDYSEVCDAISDLLSEQDKSYNLERRDRINRILENRNAEFEAAAKKNGLMTFEEYKKVPAEQRNNRNARNNAILQSMIDILSSPYALEENLSRSNFDDIIDARDSAIDPNIAKRRKARSPYNFLDQAEYQEDVMSGAKLKAFSVTRDTFCSICNTVKPVLSENNQVKVVYRAEDGYSLDTLKKSFDKVEEIQDGVFVVTHTTIGWSKDNKNAAGKILTAYSSQTTAHILDAVKEGAIPNVNDLTFQVYKLFPDFGSDYNTGVSFIMQPGISRIVEAYNSSKSIYSRGSKNPVHTAIRSIAKELLAMDGIELSDRAPIDTVVKQLQRYNSQLGSLFGAGSSKVKIGLEDKEAAKLLISGSRLKDRLNNKGIFEGSSPVEEKRKLLFDLGTIMQYNKLSHLGNSISSYARVCNPDKFGAKQTIFATNKVFRDIQRINESEESALEVINEDGTKTNFLEAIYPGVSQGLDSYIKSDNMDSKYPPLHYFLKYATATSIKVNRQLFETQDPDFVEKVMNLEQAFSGFTKERMNEKVYKEYVNYILNTLYSKTDAVQKTVTYVEGKGFVTVADSNIEEERRRIFGYGKNPDLRVPVYNIVEEEVTHITLNANEEKIVKHGVDWTKANLYLGSLYRYVRIHISEKTKAYKDIYDALSKFETTLKKDNVTVEEIQEALNYVPKVSGKNNKEAIDKFFKDKLYDKAISDAEDFYNKVLNKYKQIQTKKVSYKETEDTTEFTVDDINNPTQVEIQQYITLSPAQKVTWIQQHFREAGVFKYLKTTLFNERQYRRNKAGAQTIEYVEGNANIETVYNEFEKCFFNSNPLVALAALDIVKYGFAVEGFKMKRNAVNKVIKNSALFTSDSENGTGIVAQLGSLIGQIADGTEDIAAIQHNFIRSHANTLFQIETQRVERNDKKAFELNRTDYGMIHLPSTDEGYNPLCEKYGITYPTGDKGHSGVNKYVKLRFGKDTILYKIEEHFGDVVLYPLNKLEENENSTWSVNGSNNIYRDEEFYKSIVSEWFNADVNTTLKQVIESKKSIADAHRYVNKNRLSRTDYASTFDINEKGTPYTGGFEDVIDKTTEYFRNNPKGKLYIRNIALSKFITSTGNMGYSVQTINGKEYVIKKVDTKLFNKLYFTQGNEKRKALLPEQVQRIMEQANTYVNNMFTIEPKTVAAPTVEQNEEENEGPTVMHSSVTELGSNSMNAMYRRRNSEGDINAGKALQRLNEKGITSKDASVKENVNEVMSTTAEYVTITTNKILNDLEYFIMDDEGHHHSVNDSITIDLIRNNPAERRRFLKTLLDARAFVRNYRMINELDIDSEDVEIRNDLRKIKEAINKLQNATIINNAETRFANEYLAKLSDNPLVQNDIISLLDGYHSAGAFDAWVNDLQETSSPLLQIVTKEVMGDIRAKEMQATQRIREFKARVKKIKDDAKAAGVTIDWKNIIDEYGKFIQDYNQAFLDRMEELRNAVESAKAEFDEGSLEHLKAKFEYDKWKLNHVHQRLVDDYYYKKLEQEEKMLTSFKNVYSAYKKLEAKRTDILSHMSNGTLEERYQEELRKVKADMDNLSNPYFYDAATGNFEEKYSVDDPSNPFSGEKKLIYSIEASNALKNYLTKMKEIRDEYFTQDAKFGFDEELEKNLDTISNYEKRDSNGRITVPVAELMKHEDYVRAKEWVERNARYSIDPETQKFINKAFAALREGKDGRNILSTIAKRRNAYDNHGVINALLFTDKDIETIRQEQLTNYNIREGQPLSDRSLISNAPTDDTVFKPSFYKGMTSEAAKNEEYIAKVNEINQILVKYYDPATRTIHTSEIEEKDIIGYTDESGTFHPGLEQLYDELDATKKYINRKDGKKIHNYIKANVEFVYDEDKFRDQKFFAEQKGARYLRLWQRINEVLVEDEDGNVTVQPNPHLYGYAIPKGYKADGTGDNSQVDRPKTDALRTIHAYCNTVKTEYYYKKYKEMRSKTDAEFDAWYRANHIYNPYNHTYEPLQCWTRMEVNPMADDGVHSVAGVWTPAFAQMQSRPKDGMDKNGNPDGTPDYTNHKYRQGMSHASNYKAEGMQVAPDPMGIHSIKYKDTTNYDNNAVMNKHEREMSEYFQETLQALAHTTSAKRYFDRGYMPSRAKRPERDSKFYAKELVKMLGWIEGASGREAWYEDIDYANDKTPDMPMASLLRSKDSVEVNRVPPKKEEGETDEAFKARVDKYQEDKKKAEEQNAKVHREMLDNDWESVMEDFITKAAHFNAVQDNKYMLFYAKQMLDKLDVYVKNEGFNDLQRDGVNSTEDQNRYVTKKDTRLQEQYVNWIRRLVYDQWKKPNNGLTRTANLLQSITSAKFMMLNVTGGIANVTVGETQILGEVFAKEYFGKKTWAMGMDTWRSGIPSYLAHMYDDKSSSVADAIIKFMNVVDFDENTGVVSVPDAEEYMKRVRDFAFSPQAMGEHFMQNGAMFSMMHSHRLIVDHDAKDKGRLSYKVVNEAEYMRDANEKALQSVLTDDQKRIWKKFVEYNKADANRTKEYAWFRKDMTTEFANLYLDNEQKEKFIAERRSIQEKAKAEFNNDETHPTLFSQMALGDDGKLAFKEGSIMESLGDEAYEILGRFKGRVISVNKKIHGVYDKLGAAKWESYWWGGIVMQYHKHIYPGIMKRYRRQGYFNEERGTIEKGCYASIKDFLALPLHRADFIKKIKAENGMTDSELEAVQGVQGVIQNYVEFATHIRTHWNMIPESERANIKRALGDFAGVFSALCMAIALRTVAGDNDDEGLLYNLAMYECDRLASESFMYNPFGLVSEGQKLWSSPVAVESGIEDMFHTAGFIAQWALQGEDFDPYYQTGLYAGENKVWVNIRRQIPMYHAINMVERLERSNKYYKLGDNMLSIIPVKDIADFIRK